MPFPYHKRFRLCGGDQGAFRSPPGPLRGPSLYTWAKLPIRNKFLATGRKRAYLSFPVSQTLSPLRRRQGAFRSPPGPLRGCHIFFQRMAHPQHKKPPAPAAKGRRSQGFLSSQRFFLFPSILHPGDEHGIPEAEEAVLLLHRQLIGRQGPLAAQEGAHQHQ